MTQQTTTIADAAHRIRAKNLGTLLNHGNTEALGRFTPWQQTSLSSLRLSGLSAYPQNNGTIKVSYLRPAPQGGHTEEWRTLVTQRDLVHHLGDTHGT